MKEAQAFLRELFGKSIPQPLKIQMWSRGDRRTRYFSTYGEAARLAKGRPPDLYVGVSLARKSYGAKRRAPAKESGGIPGLWADIDVVGGPEQKKGAAPSIDAALELAKSELEPTLVVNSGYGLQAWWLFEDGPWVFDDDKQIEQGIRMAAGWITTLRNRAQEMGFSIDATQDLARLLRVPDTVNAKGGGSAPVVGWPQPIREQDGPRYSIEDLAGIAMEAAPKVAQKALMGTVGDLDLTGDPRLPIKFDAAIENIPQFASTWYHKRREKGWSMSEYDQSLATQAAQLAWSDQEIAELIRAHRAKYDPESGKGDRPDYLARTIARAKSATHRDQKEREVNEALEELQAVAESNGHADPDHIISQFNVVLGGPKVKELTQHGRDPDTARYNLTLDNGEVVRLGPVNNLLTQGRFRARFAVVTRHVLKQVKSQAWHAAVQALLDAATVEESIDDTPEGVVTEWLRAYLDERATSDQDEAAQHREPFNKDGIVHVFADNFGNFVRGHLRINISNPDVKEMLRAAGFERKAVAYTTSKGKRSTASYYHATMEAVEE